MGNNAARGDVILHDVNKSYLRSDGKFAAAIGVNDLVIVSTRDVLVVALRDSVQDVTIVALQLKKN